MNKLEELRKQHSKDMNLSEAKQVTIKFEELKNKELETKSKIKLLEIERKHASQIAAWARHVDGLEEENEALLRDIE